MWHIDTRRPGSRRGTNRGAVPARWAAAQRGAVIGAAWGVANVAHQVAVRWWAGRVEADKLEPLARTATLTATGTLSLIIGVVAAATAAYFVWPWSRGRVRDECGTTVAVGVAGAWALTWLATLVWRVLSYVWATGASDGFANPVTLPLLAYLVVGIGVFSFAFYVRRP